MFFMSCIDVGLTLTEVMTIQEEFPLAKLQSFMKYIVDGSEDKNYTKAETYLGATF